MWCRQRLAQAEFWGARKPLRTPWVRLHPLTPNTHTDSNHLESHSTHLVINRVLADIIRQAKVKDAELGWTSNITSGILGREERWGRCDRRGGRTVHKKKMCDLWFCAVPLRSLVVVITEADILSTRFSEHRQLLSFGANCLTNEQAHISVYTKNPPFCASSG